jgi:hypothetical protein
MILKKKKLPLAPDKMRTIFFITISDQLKNELLMESSNHHSCTVGKTFRLSLWIFRLFKKYIYLINECPMITYAIRCFHIRFLINSKYINYAVTCKKQFSQVYFRSVVHRERILQYFPRTFLW